MKVDLMSINDEIGRISLGAHAYWVNMTASAYCFVFFIQYLLDQKEVFCRVNFRQNHFSAQSSFPIMLILELLKLQPQNSCKTLMQIYLLLFNFESISTGGNKCSLCANFTVYLQNYLSRRVTEVQIIAKVST